MSFEIHWEHFNKALAEELLCKLRQVIQQVNQLENSTFKKPTFLGDIEILDLNFGTIPPKLELLDITDIPEALYVIKRKKDREPWESLRYSQNEGSIYSNSSSITQVHDNSLRPNWDAIDEIDSDEESVNHFEYHHHRPLLSEFYEGSHFKASPEDVLLKFQVDYAGDLELGLKTELVLNFPMSGFATLPMMLKVVGVKWNAQVLLAYFQKRIRVSLLPNKDSNEEFLKELKLESSLGEVSKHTLKNVDQVENFLLLALRKLLKKHLLFPNFLDFDTKKSN